MTELDKKAVWQGTKVYALLDPIQETRTKRPGFLFDVRNVETTTDKDE
jgi:hypothetical protein